MNHFTVYSFVTIVSGEKQCYLPKSTVWTSSQPLLTCILPKNNLYFDFLHNKFFSLYFQAPGLHSYLSRICPSLLYFTVADFWTLFFFIFELYINQIIQHVGILQSSVCEICVCWWCVAAFHS